MYPHVSQEAEQRCERNPRCTRGHKHGGRGGHCSLEEEHDEAQEEQEEEDDESEDGVEHEHEQQQQQLLQQQPGNFWGARAPRAARARAR